MTQEEIIEMAREAGGVPLGNGGFIAGTMCLVTFAKLVEDKVRQEIAEKNAPVIKKVNEHIQELQDAVKAEREACAKVCEWYSVSKRANVNYSEECAQAIRARGEA